MVRGITINRTDSPSALGERVMNKDPPGVLTAFSMGGDHSSLDSTFQSTHVSPDSPQALGGQGLGTVPLNPTRVLW